ncbi:MAG: ribosomal protein S18-alanine N-acetyltransferase [Desulfobulbaceae bacterium]|nr:ribosomal protein S18-alanine N-acetyltransferase [Desulfobulbaceae bacterium]
MSGTTWRVAAMTPADLPGVQRIESQSPAPWHHRQLAAELAWPQALTLVCRADPSGQLGGFLMARLLPPESEILKIATALAFRRQGVADLLLKSLFTLAQARGITVFHLEVRAKNHPAHALYEKHAFEMTGRRPNYYTNPQDDALCMRLSVNAG